mgnify:CR=1 FL=1
MQTQLMNTVCYYLDYYQNLVVGFWDNITFWQYILLSVTILTIGYIWMSKGATGHA